MLASPRHGRGPRDPRSALAAPSAGARCSAVGGAARRRGLRRRTARATTRSRRVGLAGHRRAPRSASRRALRGLCRCRRLDRPGVAVVVGAPRSTGWAGVSIAWSIAGDRSWEWLARGLVYLAFLALGLLAGAAASRSPAARRDRRGRHRGGARWALLGVAVPALFEDGDRIARLREPVGYWNALALLADAALALGLGWDARPGSRSALAGALLAYGATVALLLTQSRAGIAGAVAVVGALAGASDHRLADGLRAPARRAPGRAVAGWAFTRPALVEDGALRADRVADGRSFAVLALAGGIVVVLRRLAAGRAARRRADASRARASSPRVRRGCSSSGSPGVAAAVGNPFSWASSRSREGSARTTRAGSPTSARTTGPRGGGVARRRRGSAGRRLGRGHVRDRPEARPRGRDAR